MTDPVLLIFAVVALVAGGLIWRRWKNKDGPVEASQDQAQEPS